MWAQRKAKTAALREVINQHMPHTMTQNSGDQTFEDQTVPASPESSYAPPSPSYSFENERTETATSTNISASSPIKNSNATPTSTESNIPQQVPPSFTFQSLLDKVKQSPSPPSLYPTPKPR